MKAQQLAPVLALLVATACGGSPAPARPALLPLMPPAPAPTVVEAPPAEPPPTVDGDVTFGTAGGVEVVFKRIPGAEFAAAQLVVRGGARNITAANAGIEQLALLTAATGGTKSLDKTAYSRRLATLGARIYGEAGNDYSQLTMKVPVGAWDGAFALLADVFRNPALPPSEIEVVRTQTLAQLHHEQEDPDGQLWTLERKQIYAGHPYANRPVGTLDSVTAIHAEELGPYLSRLRETSRLVFVAAGDLEPQHVFDAVRSAFGDLPRGTYVDAPLPALVFDAPHLVTDQRKLPTNYCESVFPAPRPTDPEWITGLVAIHGYSWRLWQEVRTKRNLTYSVNAFIDTALSRPFGAMTVSAVDPNAAMKVMLDEARRLRDEPIGDEELAGFKSTFLTEFVEQHETPEGQVYALVQAELLGGDWRLSRGVPERVRAVTAADIQAFARKYIGHMQAAVVGDPAKVDAGLFTSL